MSEPWTTPAGVAGMHIYTLANRWRRVMDDELSALGLTYATWRPLFHLGRLVASGQHGAGIRQVMLAEAMFIEGPSLVRLLDNLERRKLIERAADLSDGRCKLISMTAAGTAIYAKAADVYDRVGKALFDGLDETHVAICCGVLEQLSRRMDDSTRHRSERPS